MPTNIYLDQHCHQLNDYNTQQDSMHSQMLSLSKVDTKSDYFTLCRLLKSGENSLLIYYKGIINIL
jgi:hypothetical protein